MERSSAFPYTPVYQFFKREPTDSPLTTVANLTFYISFQDMQSFLCFFSL